MKLSIAGLAVLGCQVILINALGDHGLAEKIFQYGAYCAEGLSSASPFTVAPGCGGAYGVARCNMDQFVRYIDTNNNLKSSSFFSTINQNTFDQQKFNSMKSAFYREWPSTGPQPGTANNAKLFAGANGYGAAVKGVAGAVGRANTAATAGSITGTAQGRLLGSISTSRQAFEFAQAKRLVQMDSQGPRGGQSRVDWMRTNVGNHGVVGGNNIITRDAPAPFNGRGYQVLDWAATDAALRAAGLGDTVDTSTSTSYSELEWLDYNWQQDSTPDPKTGKTLGQLAGSHQNMLKEFQTAQTIAGCRALLRFM